MMDEEKWVYGWESESVKEEKGEEGEEEDDGEGRERKKEREGGT